ncbi:MAG: ABC transporter substrate-binding protein [Chloroflexi bacterium]|nr:ABC transporter substrate-binding protein [Chloroflexota bacterium]
MQSRSSWVVIFLFTLLTFSAVLMFSVQAQQPTFTIGALDTPTGPISLGARLAAQQINEAGGVIGADGSTFQLEVITVPPTNGDLTSALNDLRDAGVIAVLGPQAADTILDNLSDLQALNVPVLTPATSDALLTADDSGLLFRTRASQINQNNALAAHLVEVLDLTQIATIQLDIESTERAVGFSLALSDFGVAPEPSLLLLQPDDLARLQSDLLDATPEVLAAFGSPAQAASLYRELRAAGWRGLFIYDQVSSNVFRENVPFAQLEGIVSVATWPTAAVDSASLNFLLAYARAVGAVPNPIAAASYDAINLIATALGQPGTLIDSLRQIDRIDGVQGPLTPARLGGGEMSINVAITRLNALGGSEVLARYAGTTLLPPDIPALPPGVDPTITPSPTLEGVFVTVSIPVQNVRSGPSTDFDVLGQLNEGDQREVVGATADNTWVVIDFRGQQGWMATRLLDVIGNLNDVPIIAPPATPTPNVTATPPGPVEADLIIDSAVVIPDPIIPNQTFTINVTVRNAGSNAAGFFSVGGTFPPNNAFINGTSPGLAPGQVQVIPLSGILSNTGFYSVSLIVDNNNQVFEGTVGEANNMFSLNYRIDRPIINQGAQTLNLGDTLDLEGNLVQGDVNWNANDELGLDGIFGGRIGLIGGFDYNGVHWDLINPQVIARDSLPRSELNPGTIVGVITADGNRGVMRVDFVNDTQLAVTYRVYSN